VCVSARCAAASFRSDAVKASDATQPPVLRRTVTTRTARA
jgi:hypothetical protein